MLFRMRLHGEIAGETAPCSVRLVNLTTFPIWKEVCIPNTDRAFIFKSIQKFNIKDIDIRLLISFQTTVLLPFTTT